MKEIIYPGYTTKEITKFCGESLQSIQREGIAACGAFLTTSAGNTHLLGKGDVITKNEKGELSVKDVYGKTY